MTAIEKGGPRCLVVITQSEFRWCTSLVMTAILLQKMITTIESHTGLVTIRTKENIGSLRIMGAIMIVNLKTGGPQRPDVTKTVDTYEAERTAWNGLLQ